MIKTKIIKPPASRKISISCPGCKTFLPRVVEFNQQQGITECTVCHTTFEWEETGK